MTRDQILRSLASSGHAIVKCDPGDVAATALALQSILGPVLPHARSDGSGLVTLRYAAPSSAGYRPIGESCSALHPHTDSPFLEIPPRVVALGCITPAEIGGETTLIDGQTLIRRFESQPDAIDLLTTLEVAVTRDEVCGTFPILSAAPGGKCELRFRHGEGVAVDVPAGLRSLYDAVVAYVADSHNQRLLRLAPGDLLLLDNTRMLHGRLAFQPTSTRHYVRLWYSGTADLRLGATSSR
jgi:alpha-ketoglutarate-dependent taurine dioxygenase